MRSFVKALQAGGIAKIRIRDAGLNVVGVGPSILLSGSKEADEISYVTTLTFNLDHHHHH